MSIIITGGASGINADVDTTPQALRAILYGPDGQPLQSDPSYSGIALINVRQAAATGAGAVTWGLYNPSAVKNVIIESIKLALFFDGAAVATLMRYELLRMTTITTFSGGVLVTPAPKLTSEIGAQVSQCRLLASGLTTTGGVAQSALWNGLQGRVLQTTTIFVQSIFDIPVASPGGGLIGRPIVLVQNEALVLRQLVTSVIGDNVVGAVEFREQDV